MENCNNRKQQQKCIAFQMAWEIFLGFFLLLLILSFISVHSVGSSYYMWNIFSNGEKKKQTVFCSSWISVKCNRTYKWHAHLIHSLTPVQYYTIFLYLSFHSFLKFSTKRSKMTTKQQNSIVRRTDLICLPLTIRTGKRYLLLVSTILKSPYNFWI